MYISRFSRGSLKANKAAVENVRARFSFLNTQVTARFNIIIIIRCCCCAGRCCSNNLHFIHFAFLRRRRAAAIHLIYIYLRAEELSLEFAALKIRKREKKKYNHEYTKRFGSTHAIRAYVYIYIYVYVRIQLYTLFALCPNFTRSCYIIYVYCMYIYNDCVCHE